MKSFRKIHNLERLGKKLVPLCRPGKIIGFDVFDTLLRRRLSPETVKDLVAKRTAGWICSQERYFDWKLLRHERFQLECQMTAENAAKELDTEFNHQSMVRRWLAPHGFGGVEFAWLHKKIENLELELERLATTPNIGIRNVLRDVRLSGARVLFVSDFYLSVESIWKLLQHHNLADFFDEGYCSSSRWMIKKNSGRLHQLVMQLENIRPSDYIFVGDNEISDVRQVISQGATALHLTDKSERLRNRKLQLLERLQQRNPFWSGAYSRELLEHFPVNSFRPGADCPHYRVGALVAPLYTVFVERILKEVEARKIDRIYFLAREGLLFQWMYNRLARARGLKVPKARYVCVSRRSTFLASMQELSVAELQRIWRQYPNQSISRLCKNLTLPLKDFEALAKEAGFLDLEEPIRSLSDDPRVARFIGNKDVQRCFLVHRDRTRTLLHRYLEQRDFFKASRVAIVDIGWKGSIQNFIVRSLTERHDSPSVHGFYFALSRENEADHIRRSKDGLVVDSDQFDLLANVVFENGPLFEISATAAHGTTIGYEERSSRGRVYPVLDRHNLENDKYEKFFVHSQRGIRDWFQNYCTLSPLLSTPLEETLPYWIDEVRRYIRHPSKEEVLAFIQYGHMESFGVLGESTFDYKSPKLAELLRHTKSGLLPNILSNARRHFWPAVVFERCGVPFASSLYELQQLRVLPIDANR